MHFVWTFNGRSDLGLEITNKISLLSWIFLQFDQFIITFRFTFRFFTFLAPRGSPWTCEIKIEISNPELISTLMVKENPKCVDGLILESPAFKLHEATAKWYIVLGKN